MTTAKEKINTLSSGTDTKFLAEVQQRIKNRKALDESFTIAMKVLIRLDELGWSQKTLAEKMNVKPQQVNKITKGKQNLTLETLITLQDILDIPLLASYHEKRQKEEVKKYTGEVIAFIPVKNMIGNNYNNAKGQKLPMNIPAQAANEYYVPKTGN